MNDRGWRGGVGEMALMKEGAVCVVRALCLCLSVMRPIESMRKSLGRRQRMLGWAQVGGGALQPGVGAHVHHASTRETEAGDFFGVYWPASLADQVRPVRWFTVYRCLQLPHEPQVCPAPGGSQPLGHHAAFAMSTCTAG